MALKTNYVDDVLNTSKNTVRRYDMVTNSDGTISLYDSTSYTQVGDEYGASQVNEQNKMINNLDDTSFKSRTLSASTNINNLYSDNQQGIYRVSVSSNTGTSNHPFLSGSYTLLVFSNLQIAINDSSAETKIRKRVSGTWTSWIIYSQTPQKTTVTGAFSGTSIPAGTSSYFAYNLQTIMDPNVYKIDHVIFKATNKTGLLMQDMYVSDSGVNFDIYNANSAAVTTSGMTFDIYYVPR